MSFKSKHIQQPKSSSFIYKYQKPGLGLKNVKNCYKQKILRTKIDLPVHKLLSKKENLSEWFIPFSPWRFWRENTSTAGEKEVVFQLLKTAIGKLNHFYYFSSRVAIKANYYSVFSGFVALFSCLTVFNSNKFSRQIFLTLAPKYRLWRLSATP